jgi:hypothetical protein
MSHPTESVRAAICAMCGSGVIVLSSCIAGSATGETSATPVRMGVVVQLAASLIGYVRVELRRREVGVTEHLLHRAEISPAFQQMRRERVAKEMRMDAFGLEPGLLGELAQDEKRPRARQCAALRVQEELRPVPLVEERPPTRLVAAQCIDGLAAERHDPLLPAFAGAAHEPLRQIDPRAFEADGFADP